MDETPGYRRVVFCILQCISSVLKIDGQMSLLSHVINEQSSLSPTALQIADQVSRGESCDNKQRTLGCHKLHLRHHREDRSVIKYLSRIVMTLYHNGMFNNETVNTVQINHD